MFVCTREFDEKRKCFNFRVTFSFRSVIRLYIMFRVHFYLATATTTGATNFSIFSTSNASGAHRATGPNMLFETWNANEMYSVRAQLLYVPCTTAEATVTHA